MYHVSNRTFLIVIFIMLFNFLCWNVRGIMSSAYSLSDTLDNQRIDLALITEHKLLPRSQHFLSSINQNFYAYNTCDSSTDNFGNLRCGKAGTAILIRKTLQKYVSRVNISNERIIGIELRSGNQLPLYVFCVYMPADNDVILYNETLCDIQSVFSHYCKMGTVIFAGDFNAQLDTVHLTHVRTGVCQATPLRSSLYSFTTVARRTCKVFSNIRFIFSIALYGKYIRKLYKIDTIFL